VKKRLRTGFTTGACAAAATKGAILNLLSQKGMISWDPMEGVEIPFPDGLRHRFCVEVADYSPISELSICGVIKDAGDDPDITNGALILSEVQILKGSGRKLLIDGGRGVGRVTKPGLAVAVGEAAINPVPRKMIQEAAIEALGGSDLGRLKITISVPEGEVLAKKTLNPRLGILGGISILGTTGIVKPLSTEAWRATITTQMEVATAIGLREIVLSTGRSSEEAHMRYYRFPKEAYIMAGDFVEFSLLEAKRFDFSCIHFCGQFAKLLKISMSTGNTHVRYGALDVEEAIRQLGVNPIKKGQRLNTARELLGYLKENGNDGKVIILHICEKAGRYMKSICNIPCTVTLIDYDGHILTTVEIK
jgi:cobalt-precorrin-5B (C1)-methyltransferase